MSKYLCAVTQTTEYNTSPILYSWTEEIFWGRVSKLPTNFEESILRAHENLKSRESPGAFHNYYLIHSVIVIV